MKKIKYVLIFIVLIFFVFIFENRIFNTEFQELKDFDKEILTEYDKFYRKDEKLWPGYNFKEKPILVFSGNIFQDAYLITEQDVKSIFAKKITMPSDFHINVYRIAKSNLNRFSYLNGNFNTKDKKYSMCGINNLFYVKTNKNSLSEKWNSERFMPFLAHEAFHFYMQNGWDDPTFRGLSYSESELDLLNEEYEVFDKLNNILKEDPNNSDAVIEELKNYKKVMKKRIENTDKEKLNAEIGEETIEGTAEYVGIKAAKSVDYDYDVMYFTNTKDVKFSDVVPGFRNNLVDQSLIGSKMVYESGALLCFAMDAAKIENWQEKLNENGGEKFVTIYDIIDEYLEEIDN